VAKISIKKDRFLALLSELPLGTPVVLRFTDIRALRGSQ
jgi:hypothetical protein